MTANSSRATFAVGHWTDSNARTGCSVILFDRLVPAIVDIRGGAPGTRETDVLAQDRLVGQADAFLLTGGSANGLTAADGVMQFLRERQRGFPTAAAPVPIVPAAVIFDLAVGDPTWPTAESGYSACQAAGPITDSPIGLIGAGVGATTAKLWPGSTPSAGGLGWSVVPIGDNRSVYAIAVVNAVGEIVTEGWTDKRSMLLSGSAGPGDRAATTLVVVVVDDDADERTLRRIGISAHDAMARAIVPCHTLWDGDLVFAAQTGSTTQVDQTDIVRLTVAAELAVEQAIRASISG